eukprot:jgi/Astpho2/3606/e_gw1.00058.35.1_t
MQRLAGGCRHSWLHLNAHCANRHRLEGRQPHRQTPQRQRAWFDVKAAEAGSSTDVSASSSRTVLGEDSAAFDSRQQSTQSWTLFTGLLLGVLGLIYVTWIDPETGVANQFLDSLKSISSNTEVVMLLILGIFAAAHSGLAYLRPYGEDLIGPRAYRVVFALVSLPLAALALVYFINHRYSGTPLWNVRGEVGVHELVWVLNFVSFFFLYPSTFNILEVAAVDTPKLHLWETGVIRITRHPQCFGQFLWCAAHCLWIGNSFMVTTSAGLMAHHFFSCWHGDFRQRRKYGEAFDIVKERTSIIPFAAIVDGRQQLPAMYYKEFLRLPYFTILLLTLGAYWAHPLMQAGSHWLGW